MAIKAARLGQPCLQQPAQLPQLQLSCPRQLGGFGSIRYFLHAFGFVYWLLRRRLLCCWYARNSQHRCKLSIRGQYIMAPASLLELVSKRTQTLCGRTLGHRAATLHGRPFKLNPSLQPTTLEKVAQERHLLVRHMRPSLRHISAERDASACCLGCTPAYSAQNPKWTIHLATQCQDRIFRSVCFEDDRFALHVLSRMRARGRQCTEAGLACNFAAISTCTELLFAFPQIQPTLTAAAASRLKLAHIHLDLAKMECLQHAVCKLQCN